MFRAVPRTVPRLTTGAQLSRQAVRRGFADQAPANSSKVESSRPVPANPAGGNSRLPFIIGGGLLFIMVAGRYIFASNKPMRSEQATQQALQREGDVSKEYRDPRDSGVKTLEQKKQKEQGS